MIQRRDDTATVWTVAELLKWTEGHFQRLGLPSPRLDAEILLAKVLGRTRVELYTGYGMLVQPEERARFRVFVERRSRREPVAYITGRREFFSLAFEVSPAVLVPRPETEHLVEAVLKEIAASDESPNGSGTADEAPVAPSPPLRILDLGTGSGCIAVAIAVKAPLATVDAVDSSGAALEVARRNAETHGVEGRVRFFQGDLLAALPADILPYRAIVSNPPYVSAAELESLMDDVRLHEPREALLDTKSADGLGFYRAIARGVAPHLEPGGILAVEVGAGQAASVRDIFGAGGWSHRETIRDYAGIERVIVVAR
jgi:release factor glutamine methyltransferase